MTEPAPFSGTYPDELRDVVVGIRALQDAEPGYLRAHDYFTGRVPEYFASPALARKVGRTGSSFRVNLAKKGVTSASNRMEVATVSVPGNDALTQVLQAEVFDANELALELPEWLERMCEYGDAYAFVWPNDDDGVDIEFSSPLTTRAIYDPERPRRIKYVIKWWTQGAGERKVQRVNLYYFGTGREGQPGYRVGRIEKWVTREGTNGSEAIHWTPWEGTEDEPDEPVIDNPHGQIVFHFRTARPYGVPLHFDAYGPQDAINKIIVSLMSTMDYHIVPQRALLTETEADDDDDDFDDFSDEEDDPSSPTDGERPGNTKLASGPGSLWILKNAKSLVSLPAADPANFLNPADFFLRMMATTSDMPLHFYDPGGDQPSGDSRRQSEGTLTKKVERLQDSVENTLSAMLSKAMQMLGYDVDRVEVEWAPSQIVDDSEGWTTAKAKIDAGVPVGQVLQEMGYDATQVAEWLSNNDEQDLRRRVNLLAELGKAVRDLGAGVGAGLLPPELVEQVMAGFIGQEPDDGGQ